VLPALSRRSVGIIGRSVEESSWILRWTTAIIKGVPHLSRICAIAVVLLTSGHAVSAIEKFTFIRTADAVVVGQLKLSSYFLSFDGLHVNGTIVATEILMENGNSGPEFAYHLVVPCSLWHAILGSCDYLAAWQHWFESKEFFTQNRIWALVKGPGSSWTSVEPRQAGVYDLADREKVIAVLKEQLEHGRPKR
jgi:hypothetical protein